MFLCMHVKDAYMKIKRWWHFKENKNINYEICWGHQETWWSCKQKYKMHINTITFSTQTAHPLAHGIMRRLVWLVWVRVTFLIVPQFKRKESVELENHMIDLTVAFLLWNICYYYMQVLDVNELMMNFKLWLVDLTMFIIYNTFCWIWS